MTIKLALFMLDPVTAHAKYMKEIADLSKPYLEIINNMQKTIDKQAKKNATLKHEMKRILNETKQ